jgi:hypothetical protein
MSSTTVTSVGHPIAVFVDELHAGLDALADVPAWSTGAQEQRAALVSLSRARARLDELWLQVLAAGDRSDIAADSAATSTAAWLAAATRRHPGAAHADVTLAAALDDGREATRAALAAGDIDLEQTRVVVAAVRALPTDAVAEDPTCPAQAEATLLDLARAHDARTLKALGRHLLHVLDPDAAEGRLGRQLEPDERAAARATFLELHDNDDGTHGGRFRLPTLHAAALSKVLDAITNPARQAGAERGSPRRTRPELRGQAFCELLERIPTDRLPVSGGVNATVVVMLDYDTLLSGLGTARLDTGEPISAGLARRLACQGGVIPAVVRRLVDGRSVVLDMGRKRRLHTEHMPTVGCSAATTTTRPTAPTTSSNAPTTTRSGSADARDGRAEWGRPIGGGRQARSTSLRSFRTRAPSCCSMSRAGSSSLPLRVISLPFSVRVTFSWCSSTTVPSAEPVPHDHDTAVPVRIAIRTPVARRPRRLP